MMLIEIEKLRPHTTALSFVPRMSEPEFQAFLNDIKQNGIIDPVEVIPDKENENLFWIIDGTHRYVAAQKLNIKKIPVVVKNIPNEKLENYIISKAVHRRNMSLMQKVVLAVEYINKNNISEELFDEIANLFSITKKKIKIILKTKKEYPKIYEYIKNGLIDDFNKILELIYKKEKDLDFPVIEEFQKIPENIRIVIKKIPPEVQEKIFYYASNNRKQKNLKNINEDNKLTEKTEKNHIIQKLTNDFFLQKKKAEEIKRKFKETKQNEKKLEKLVQKLQFLINELYEKQQFVSLSNSVQKHEIGDIIIELNKLKQQLQLLKELKIPEKKNKVISAEDIQNQIEITALFSYFLQVFSDFNISKINNLLNNPNILNKQIIYNIYSLTEKLNIFINILLTSFNNLILKISEENINRPKNENKYLVIKNSF